MKINENLKNLFIDIFFSTNWGVDNKTFLVTSDDENIQKRINKLDKHEHEVLGEILFSSFTRNIEQGSV